MRKLCAVFALSLMPLAAVPGAQDSGESLPKLISHADAEYPSIARTAHIMGDVVVKITTDGQSVVDAQAESGPTLLQRASIDNAKTWKFAPHTPGTFHVTYRFELTPGDVLTSFPDSPSVVEVRALPQVMTAVGYAWGGLGMWRAELRSPHGRFSKVFAFLESGPRGEWLKVDTPGSTSEKEYDENGDEEFSRKDGDFLIFSMKLVEPDGQRPKTYLTGKMSGNNIVGTFVDESGVRGTWSAARITDSEKK
jgi:Gram-negative bacterial TonB protein C-terminal